MCTAFCVRHDVVATAAHCLYRTSGERPPRLADFWFLRNYDAVRDICRTSPATATARPSVNVISGSTRLNVHPPIDATRDWALVRLAQPVSARACCR